jgi:hypothetical protein
MGSSEAPQNMQQNCDGEWVPAIPEPLRGFWWKQCQCEEEFLTMRGYRGHYALAHILKVDA